MRSFAFFVLAALVAGCIDIRGELEAPPIPEIAMTIPWRLDGCQAAVAVIPMEAEALAQRTPAGFRILPVTEIPGFPVPDRRKTGNLGVEMWTCASGIGLNESVNLTPTVYGSIFSFVEAPEAMRDANVTYHFLKWDTLVPDDARRMLLLNESAPVLPGNATFSRFQPIGPGSPLPPGKSIAGAMRLGNDNYTFSATGLAPQDITRLSWIEFTPTEYGFVKWRANFTAPDGSAGSGNVDISGSSWVRDAVREDNPQAYYTLGVGSLNGTISIPGHD